jgi:hypothetical protein
MAILAQTRVLGGTRDDMEVIESQMEAHSMRAGHPPEGLMATVVHPDEGDFIIAEVWRTEDEMREWLDAVILPGIIATGKSADPTSVSPVWAFARP